MKTIKQTLVVAIALVASLSQAVVRETNSMTEVLNEVTPQTFVVFDLDNTLIEASQTLGSDQWFDASVKQIGLEPTVALWMKIQERTLVRPVESITPNIIRALQSQGIPVIGLTARPFEATQLTIRQLASVGIDLSVTAPFKEGFVMQGVKERAEYNHGIVFAGGNPKGPTLIGFFQRTAIAPNRVVFTDDKGKHTTTVDASLSAAGIEAVEFRYGAADARVKAFNPEIAAVQLRFFFGILDDESAEVLATH